MVEAKTRRELYLRLGLRIFAATGIGLLTSIACLWFFIMWCIIFFPQVTLQSPIFVLAFINVAVFLGALLGGYLSLTLKRSLITATCMAIILGIVLIWIGGILPGVLNILFIFAGGLLGGDLLGYIREK
jgi:hypothetical protein